MIQRYDVDRYGFEMVVADGPYVLYADHLAALTVTDEMVERACAKFDTNWKRELWRLQLDGMLNLVTREPFYDDEIKAMMRTEMRAALEAALTPERP